MNRKFSRCSRSRDNQHWQQQHPAEITSQIRLCCSAAQAAGPLDIAYYAEPKLDGSQVRPDRPGWPDRFRFPLPLHDRLGFLRHIDAIGTDFIIIVDDVERVGEKRLVSEIAQALRRKGVNFNIGQSAAAKVQEIIAGGAFMRAAYL